MQAAAGNLKKVSLELGGKSPNVVYADADMDAGDSAAPRTAIFFNHGQCCNAGSRLYVRAAGLRPRGRGRRRSRPARSRSAPACDPESQMGPLISDEQFAKVLGYLESGPRGGRRGGRSAADARAIAATSCSRRS